MTNHKKKNDPYYYDRYTGAHWRVEGDIPENEVIAYIKSNWLDSHDAVIADINERRALRELACRYAHGAKHLTKRTAEARREYEKLFDENLLPKEQRRRIIDVISARIKDILPNLATRIAVEELQSEMPLATDAEIAARIYELVVCDKSLACPVPNVQFVKNIRSQIAKNDGKLPEFSLDATTKFVLSVSDQLADVTRLDNNEVALDIHMKRKKARLIFRLPDKARYETGKVSLPDIVRSAKSPWGIAFDFSIRHKAPETYEPQCSLGVDIGEIYPVVASLVGDNWHSQSFYPNGDALDMVDKLNDLAFQKSVLSLKIFQNSMPNRTIRPGQVRSFEELVAVDTMESERISAKMTDLKHELARWCAHFVCETAISHTAQIVLEKLNWSDPKHAFFYSMVQSSIANLAKVSGVPVVFVNAKDTSKCCAHDGSVLVQGVRKKIPAVKKASKKRNSWRSADNVSGVRDKAIRSQIAKNKKSSIFDVEYCDIAKEHSKGIEYRSRGARCPIEGIVRDHDAIGSMNIGIEGEITRGTYSSHHDSGNSEFRRVKRRNANIRFSWAVSLSATAAVTASAPVAGLASVSNDVVGLVDGGSPPS